jgi:hypothetical protein
MEKKGYVACPPSDQRLPNMKINSTMMMRMTVIDGDPARSIGCCHQPTTDAC